LNWLTYNVKVSESIQRGEPVHSLLRSVQLSLKFLFRPVVMKLLYALYSHFNLDTLLSCLGSEQTAVYKGNLVR